MKRIRIVLKASEVTAVRKAVCRAGGQRVLLTPLTRRACAAELADWYWGTADAGCGDHVRLDVMSDDGHADAIVSAIIAMAHTGKIEQIAQVPAREHRILSCVTKRAV